MEWFHNPRQIPSFLKEAGFKPAKSKGQNFLVDAHYVEKIVDRIPSWAERILEIGPGLGSLTSAMKRKGLDVACIELEPFFKDFIEEKLDVEVFLGDAVQVAWPPSDLVVSNLPYSASAPITFRLFEEERSAIFTYQKEVAERITAEPGTKGYSRLSVGTQARFSVEKLFSIPPGAFFPTPKVDSTVLKLDYDPVFDEATLAKIDKTASLVFSYRRKTIRSILKQSVKQGLLSDVPREHEEDGRRPGKMDLEEIKMLSLTLSPYWTDANRQ